MRSALITASLLALVAAPAAHAQQTDEPMAAPVSGQAEPGRFVVHFAFNKATLDAGNRRVVAEAADEYRRTGAARIAVTGHADRAGRAEHNQRLSERRAEAVRRELEGHGVQATDVQVAAEGENDPAVPTADGVPEARNRRVQIEVPQPPPPAPPPAVAVEQPPPVTTARAETRREERASRFGLTIGPVYGHNFKERDEGETESDLGGAELRFDALPGFLGGLSLKQDVLWSLNAIDEGLAGRSVLSLDFAPDLGFVRPRLSANFGGVYGHGVQTGFVAGPELALDLNLTPGFTLRPRVAYDYQFRNKGWDEGILWAGLDLGIRF